MGLLAIFATHVQIQARLSPIFQKRATSNPRFLPGLRKNVDYRKLSWKGLGPVTVNVLEGSSLSFGHFIRCLLSSKGRFFLGSLSPTDPQVHGTLKCSLDELCDSLVAGAGRENHGPEELSVDLSLGTN